MKPSRPRRYDSKVGTSSIISSVTGTQVAIFRTLSSRSVKSSADSGFARLGRLGRGVREGRLLEVGDLLAVVVPASMRSATVRSSSRRADHVRAVLERRQVRRGLDERLDGELAEVAAEAVEPTAAHARRLQPVRLEPAHEQLADGLDAGGEDLVLALDVAVDVLGLGIDLAADRLAHRLQRLLVGVLGHDRVLERVDGVHERRELEVRGLDGAEQLVPLGLVGGGVRLLEQRGEPRPLGLQLLALRDQVCLQCHVRVSRE
jgi:hypothetical protein